jgi:diacylglycerol kinase (CTP)
MSQPPILEAFDGSLSPKGLTRRTNGSSVQANGSSNGSVIKLNGAPANGHTAKVVFPTLAQPEKKPKEKVAIDWEIPRKALHSSIGFFSLWLWSAHGSPQRVVVALSSSLAIIIPADILRLRSSTFERVYERALGFLMRESEKKSSNGVIWFMFGAIAVLVLYPLDIALVAVVILSWADTAASTFGRLWGRYTPPLPRSLFGLPLAPRKSTAGFIAACATGALVAASFWGYFTQFGSPDVARSWTWENGFQLPGFEIGERLVKDAGIAHSVNTGGWTGLAMIAGFAGVVTGVAEALDLGSLDDNLTLPIISGTCLWAFFHLLSYVSA